MPWETMIFLNKEEWMQREAKTGGGKELGREKGGETMVGIQNKQTYIQTLFKNYRLGYESGSWLFLLSH